MGEAVLAQDPGHLRPAPRGRPGERGEVAGHVSGQQLGLVGLPETLGDRGQLVAGPGARTVIEHGRPGGPLGGLAADRGPAARRAEPPGGGDVRAGLVLKLGRSDGAKYRQPQHDLPAEPGIGVQAAGQLAGGEPGPQAGDVGGAGCAVDQPSHGDQAHPVRIAVTWPAEQVLAQAGDVGQGRRAWPGRQIAIGDRPAGVGRAPARRSTCRSRPAGA